MRVAVFRDAKHRADESETAFELWLDRAMHTSTATLDRGRETGAVRR